MKMLNRNKIMLGFLILLAFAQSASALSIGVTPGRVSFSNMLKDGYAERTVRVTTNSLDEVVARMEISGELSSWVRTEPADETFRISSESPHELRIIVETPPDARSDTYTGRLSFIVEGQGDIAGRAGGIVKPGVIVNMDATVSDVEVRACISGGFSISDTEIGFPFDVSATITNDGNVRIRPRISYEIWDQNRERIVLSGDFFSGEILPSTRKRVSRTVENSLDIGQYWAFISTDECGSSSMLTFSVVEKGGIVDRGTLERIEHRSWVSAEENVEIKAIFRNEGPRTVYAKFQGNIRLDDRIVDVIETDEISIAPDERGEFITYFRPETPGRYVISGRGIYNRKLSYERSSILNVVEKDEMKAYSSLVPFVIYIVIITTIVFLVRNIVKTKKKNRF